MTTTATTRSLFLRMLPLLVLAGCAHPQRPPLQRQPGTGIINGKLIGTDKEPFDLKLAEKPLQVKLMTADHGIVATVPARSDKPEFRFDNVQPGSYELSIYQVVPGKRTIGGDQQVTVDPDHTVEAILTLHVTEEGGTR